MSGTALRGSRQPRSRTRRSGIPNRDDAERGNLLARGAPAVKLRAMQMHSGQLTASTEVLRELVASQLPQWQGLPVHEVASQGTVNAIFRPAVSRTPTVRAPPSVRCGPHRHRWQIPNRPVHDLGRRQPRSTFRSPQVVRPTGHQNRAVEPWPRFWKPVASDPNCTVHCDEPGCLPKVGRVHGLASTDKPTRQNRYRRIRTEVAS